MNLDFLRMYSVLVFFLEGIKMIKVVYLLALGTEDIY